MLPDADELKKLEEICAGFAEIVRKGMEQNTVFAREETRSHRVSDVFNQRLGVFLAFIVAMAFLAGSCYAASLDLPYVACVLGGLPLASLVGIFIRKGK